MDPVASEQGSLGRRLATLAPAFVVVLMWLAALTMPVKTYSARLFGAMFESAALSLDQAGPVDGRILVFVNGPNFFYTGYAPVIRASLGMSLPAHYRMLGGSEDEVQVTTVRSVHAAPSPSTRLRQQHP